MEINQVIKQIYSLQEGFVIIELNNSNKLDLIEEEIKNIFFNKQYEIDANFFNLKPIENAQSISIDQIRSLKKEFLHTNVLNLKRVIFISEINLLNNNSYNSLLKIIEEVPKDTYFIFCTSNIIKIPETIISRARVIRIHEKLESNNLESYMDNLIDLNQNISEDVIKDLFDPFIQSKQVDFFERVKLFNKDQINLCSLIFVKILSYYLRLNINNTKLFKYLIKLHSDFIYDVDESIKFNTLTNDLISIYFTRLNSNILKHGN